MPAGEPQTWKRAASGHWPAFSTNNMEPLDADGVCGGWRGGWLGQDQAWGQERDDEKNTEREALLGHGSASLPKVCSKSEMQNRAAAAGRAGRQPGSCSYWRRISGR